MIVDCGHATLFNSRVMGRALPRLPLFDARVVA